MKSKKILPSESGRELKDNWVYTWRGDVLLWGFVVLMFAGLLFLFAGCTKTILPVNVASRQASWDGTNQNSGLLGRAADGRYLLTPHAHDRYNALLAVWGTQFAPPITAPDYGVSPDGRGAYLFTPEALSKFGIMLQWKRQPPKPLQ